MKALLYLTLICTLVASHVTAFSQSIKLDSIQVERIAITSQLWGHLKYFHPYLSDNSVDWESAFSNNIEQVLYAKSGKKFGEAVQKILDQLNDPATKVIFDQEIRANDDSLKYPVIKFIQDSILLISIKDYGDLEDFNFAFEQFSSLKKKLPLSNGLIIDIRSPEDIGDLGGYLPWYFKEIERNFSANELEVPGYKARFHDGFIPETGGTSGGYSSGYYVKGEKKIPPATNAMNEKIVFLVNENSDIPIIAIALQEAGDAKIVSTTPITDASIAESFILKLDDSLEVRIRLNELFYDNDIKEDYLIPTKLEEEEVLSMALQLLRGQEIDKFPDLLIENKPIAINSIKNQNKSKSAYPELGHRLLAAAKMWTVINYFFAYKDLMEDDWEETLKKFIPQFAAASDSVEYHLAVAEMYKHIQDGHGYIRSKVLTEYFGSASPPIKIRFIEDNPVVVGILPDSIYKVKGMDIGDIIMEIDGEDANDRYNRYAKYIASSNQSWLKNMTSRKLLNGKDSTDTILKIQKGDGRVEIVKLPINDHFKQKIAQLGNDRNHEQIIKLINENIGYADLDRLTVDMVDQMFENFANTRAIIFDMRGYPNGTAWSIAPHLTAKENVYAANFRRYSPMSINTGESKNMTFFNQLIPPSQLPTYEGITIMLIDERTISQSEHTGLFFEAANGTKFIGSQTAGANGDVTNFEIPGNIVLSFSGHDVRHIDGRQLQKIGLVPDLQLKPTIKGIREGKDEILEKAIEYVESILEE